jgi:hypothetical protein
MKIFKTNILIIIYNIIILYIIINFLSFQFFNSPIWKVWNDLIVTCDFVITCDFLKSLNQLIRLSSINYIIYY